MPTYNYKCNECETELEEFMSISEFKNKEIKCPECDAVMNNILGAPAFNMGGMKTVIKNHKNKYGSDTNNVPKSKDNGVKIYGKERKS